MDVCVAFRASSCRHFFYLQRKYIKAAAPEIRKGVSHLCMIGSRQSNCRCWILQHSFSELVNTYVTTRPSSFGLPVQSKCCWRFSSVQVNEIQNECGVPAISLPTTRLNREGSNCGYPQKHRQWQSQTTQEVNLPRYCLLPPRRTTRISK